MLFCGLSRRGGSLCLLLARRLTRHSSRLRISRILIARLRRARHQQPGRPCQLVHLRRERLRSAIFRDRLPHESRKALYRIQLRLRQRQLALQLLQSQITLIPLRFGPDARALRIRNLLLDPGDLFLRVVLILRQIVAVLVRGSRLRTRPHRQRSLRTRKLKRELRDLVRSLLLVGREDQLARHIDGGRFQHQLPAPLHRLIKKRDDLLSVTGRALPRAP